MAEVVAGAFFSAFFQQVFQKIDSGEVKNFIRGNKRTEGLLQKLKIKLLSVGKVYEDAEEKQIRDSDVKQWLVELKDAVYHAQDLLDEIKTEGLKQADRSRSGTSKVKQFLSAPFHAFHKSVDTRIEEILERLEFIAKQKDDLNLEVVTRHRVSQTLPSTSLVEDSGVYGRDEDKKTIIQLLLSNDATGNKIGVIPIVGMGGIGKTTLAQLLYNDVRVKNQFEPRAWVCVTEEFDIVRITQTIYGSVTSQTCDITDLDQLQVKLQQALSGKKFLFVLDDVWDENYIHWDSLRRPFESGADGSKIIVATRNAGVASMVGTCQTHHLMKISDEECWLLFSKHAFRSISSVSAHPNLEVIGRQIVKKCQGLPLAAKSLGGLLCNGLSIEDWENVLKSDIWELSHKETNILPALWLSYRYLPLHLKCCFAYCSIFPKDYEFEKFELVLLWMAEDLLQPTTNKMVEEVGEEYFNDLISRSFFQQSPVDVFSGQPLFTMHDLTNDLAKLVSGDFCVRWEDNSSLNNSNKTRHFSYLKGRGGPNFEKFEAKYLRTLLSVSLLKGSGCMYSQKLPDLSKLQCLRVLNLSANYSLWKLPKSISKLKHVRHLDLSHTKIRKLPDTMCTLYNLQTLLLLECSYLTELPTNLGRLINLRHLDIEGTGINKMPPQMGKLFKDLRTLSYFALDKQNGGNIVELKEFHYLRGMLHISGLQNIVRAKDAVEANLREKYLDQLILEWANGRSLQNHREVLDNLQPHANLKALEILSYGGTRFPSWLGDESFSNLVSVRLRHCGYCLSLPSLGQLPSLAKLEIVGFSEVVSIGPEFYAGGFPNLCELRLQDCPKLSGRFLLDYFPKLEKLTIENANVESLATSNCPKLLLSLRELDITECPNFVYFPDGGLQAPNLTNIQILSCEKLRSLPEEMHTLLPSLQSLVIGNCPELESFPEGGLPSKLQSLDICYCEKLIAKRMQWGLQRLTSLKLLGVGFKGCEEVDSFPEEGLLPTTLTSLIISDCLNLKTLNGKELRHLTSLKTLYIWSCPELQCLPDEGLPASLSRLEIRDCPLLTQRCQRETGEDWPKMAHIPNIYIHQKPTHMIWSHLL